MFKRDERLTPNFKLNEFLVSETARAQNIRNIPTAEHRANLLVTAVGLEQVRSLLFDNRIKITSGYRSPELNKAVGGVPTSDHALGFAADITVATYTTLEAAEAIFKSPIVYDQLIYEPSRGIIHISFNPRLRRQTLTQRGGPGTPVEKGILA